MSNKRGRKRQCGNTPAKRAATSGLTAVCDPDPVTCARAYALAYEVARLRMDVRANWRISMKKDELPSWLRGAPDRLGLLASQLSTAAERNLRSLAKRRAGELQRALERVMSAVNRAWLSPARENYIMRRDEWDDAVMGCEPSEVLGTSTHNDLLNAVIPLSEASWQMVKRGVWNFLPNLPSDIANWAGLGRIAAALFKESYDRDEDETDLAEKFISSIEPLQSHELVGFHWTRTDFERLKTEAETDYEEWVAGEVHRLYLAIRDNSAVYGADANRPNEADSQLLRLIRSMDKTTLAIFLLDENDNLSKLRAASLVGCDPSTLYRDPRFKSWRQAKGTKGDVPIGHVNRTTTGERVFDAAVDSMGERRTPEQIVRRHHED